MKFSAAVMKHYDAFPNETALVLDSLDEVVDQSFIKDLTQVMKSRERGIIACVRTNHPAIDDLHDVTYVHNVKVDGFRKEDILEYIERYFEEDEMVVDRFRTVIESETRLQTLFKNPLLLCLVCILVAEGHYTTQDLASITKIDIYAQIEELVCRREGWTYEEVMINLKRFHEYALLVLLEEKELFLTDMEKHKIDPRKLPFVHFENDELAIIYHGSKIVWPHRSFVEFSAAKCIADSDPKLQDLILLYICCQRKLNNVLLLLAELLKYDEDIIKKYANAILALQVRIKSTHRLSCHTPKNNKVIDKLLSNKPSEIFTAKSKNVDRAIAKGITPCQICWKSSRLISQSGCQAAFQNASDLIKTLPMEHGHQRLFSEILSPLVSKSK